MASKIFTTAAGTVETGKNKQYISLCLKVFSTMSEVGNR
jgi:hypothetical protein